MADYAFSCANQARVSFVQAIRPGTSGFQPDSSAGWHLEWELRAIHSISGLMRLDSASGARVSLERLTYLQSVREIEHKLI
jgi:hypothetical protein